MVISIQKKWGILALLLFSFILLPSLNAFSFKDIVFTPASSEFILEDVVQTSISNLAKITIKVEDENQTKQEDIATLEFYHYDSHADSYIHIETTDFSPSEALIGSFNPMTPLLLENGQTLDISKKIPVIKCLVFKRNEPLIVVYHDSSLSDKKDIKLNISTDKDREIIRLKHSDENASIFVGYINTTTKCQRKCDGKLFVEKGTHIEASLWAKSAKQSKSRSFQSRIFATATIEGESLEIKSKGEREVAKVWVSLKSSKESASMGEFIHYICEIENRGNKDAINANFSNILSKGLRYKKNTFFIDEVKVDNIQFLNKREFQLPLDIKAGESKHFSFVAEVGIDAENLLQSRAFVNYNNKQSNLSISQTKVKKDFDHSSLIAGRVIVKDANLSLSGVRVYLENGLYTHSDKSGKFHFENVSLGRHVVSIDPDSISGRFVLQECQANARTMGSRTSIFVDTSISHTQAVKFCLKEDKKTKALHASLSFKIPTKEAQKMPKYTVNSFKEIEKRDTFLWPKEGYVPPMPSVKVAFLHASKEKIELYLNGKKVDMLEYDGFVKSKDTKWTISKYRGVDIIDGDNIFEAKIKGTSRVIKRTIHLSTAPIKAKIITEKSSLVADGQKNPVIAVQLFDMAGYPLRKGMVGEFSIEKPYISQERLEYLQKNPLANGNGEDRYTVSENGIAFITLHATSQAGEVKLHFPFQRKNEYTKVWLSSAPREWFMVGFAEGSVGYETLKNSLQNRSTSSLKSDAKVSFFAKGKVGTDALLSIAYDSGKKNDLAVLEELNPQSEYTVYADESMQKNEAPSSKKLYLKIEKKTFYALFGDFNTGLDTHELSRYVRRLNGIKSEFKGEIFEYSAFISQSSTSFEREELRGDGTSGLYQLKSKTIMIGSENIMIQVRDRYRDEVILSKKVLRPLLDYNIDYLAGTIYFKEPILSKDKGGNPQYIIVTYEDEKGDKKRLSYGGRAGIRGFDGRLEGGVSILREENKEHELDTLYGFDTQVNLTENLTINGEYASSKNNKEVNTTVAKAYLFELAHHNKYSTSKAYYHYQEDGFGFGQQSHIASGMRKYGVDTTLNYWQNIAVKLALYGDEVLSSSEKKSVAELSAQYEKQGASALLGYRYAKAGDEEVNSQLISTISKRFFKNKMKLSLAYEYTLGEQSDHFLNRTFAEASYFANQYIEIFANHEILKGKTIKSNQSRIGVKGRPWSGGTLQSTLSNEVENDAVRLFGLMGFNQSWQINQNISLNGSLEREQTFQSDEEIEDFTAYAIGANYQKKQWIYNAKAEYKTTKREEKVNFDAGVYTEVNKNLGMALGIRNNFVYGDNANRQNSDVKFSLAYRPDESLMVLNRLAYLYDKTDNTKVAKAVEQFLCVAHLNQKNSLSGHYGLKYVEDTMDEDVFSSWIDTAGVEYRYDLSKYLELGLQGSVLHAYESGALQKSVGLYLGYNLLLNTYIGFGYNFLGFDDEDFSTIQQSQEGLYLRFRVKFDQEGLEEALKFF
jgi:uncharacterized repeat protein (TIGR01451 family)